MFGNRKESNGTPDLKRHRRFLLPAVIAAALLALAAAAGFAGASDSGRIHPGVEVGGVDVGGMDRQEAEGVLAERSGGEALPEELRFVAPQGDFTLDGGTLGVSHDVSASADAAYAVGREGNLLERLAERGRAALDNRQVEPAVEYDRRALRASVEGLAERLNVGAQSASVSLTGTEVAVTGGREGYELNVPATTRAAAEAIESLEGEVEVSGRVLEPQVGEEQAERAAAEARRAVSSPLVLSSGGEEWTVAPGQVGRALGFERGEGGLSVGLDRQAMNARLAEALEALEEEPTDAGFETSEGGISVTPSEGGAEVDAPRLLGEIEAGIFEGRHEYEVPVTSVRPELSTEEAERLKPTEMLGRYRTDYTLSGDDSPERVENLELVSGAVNGTVLAPGEVFSYNELAAPLDYNETQVIVDGRVDYADGGGLCQTASTLYMAANYAGLEPIERHPHYAELPYIRPGLDATVWFGSLDMKFRNTTDAYVLLRKYVADDGYVYAEVWGQPDGTEVEMDSRRVSASGDSTAWITYKTVEQNGEVVFDGEFRRDTYEPLMGEDGELIPNADPAPVDP